jgi:hypothetical protein
VASDDLVQGALQRLAAQLTLDAERELGEEEPAALLRVP